MTIDAIAKSDVAGKIRWTKIKDILAIVSKFFA